MASNIWANEQLSHNAALQNIKIAQKRDVIEKIWAQMWIQHPKVTPTLFSKSMQEKKFFLLTSVMDKKSYMALLTKITSSYVVYKNCQYEKTPSDWNYCLTDLISADVSLDLIK